MESRFAHLLKPIRDLARNWDIDIASELEDYLAEVPNSQNSPCLAQNTLSARKYRFHGRWRHDDNEFHRSSTSNTRIDVHLQSKGGKKRRDYAKTLARVLLQVEHLYTLVYQALDLLSTKK